MTTGAVRSIRRTPSSSAPASASARGVPGLPTAGLSEQAGDAKRAALSLARRGGASRRGESSRATWPVRPWLTRVNLAGLHVEPGSEGSQAQSMQSVSTCTAAEKKKGEAPPQKYATSPPSAGPTTVPSLSVAPCRSRGVQRLGSAAPVGVRVRCRCRVSLTLTLTLALTLSEVATQAGTAARRPTLYKYQSTTLPAATAHGPSAHSARRW